MPHRQIIDAARVQIGAALTQNMITTDPKEIPFVAQGWSIELRETLVKTVGPDETERLLTEQARAAKELTEA